MLFWIFLFDKLQNEEISVYGKTGTAQVCSNCDLEAHGWFAGYIELLDKQKYSI